MPALVELGLAEPEGERGWRISYANLASLGEEHGITAFEGLAPWAYWPLQVESSGSPGLPGFAYYYHYLSAHGPIYPQRRGCFLNLNGKIRRIDRPTFALVEAIDGFMALPTAARSGADGFLRFAEVKNLAEEVGAQLDSFLLSERVIVPPDIELDVVPEPGGRISFAPLVNGVPAEALRQAFFANDDPEAVYSLAAPDGGRLRVVFNAQQREALRRMQRARHLGGAERAAVLRDPHAIFDGVGDAISLAGYGARVKGIGDFPFVVRPYLSSSGTGVLDDPDRQVHGPRSGIECTYADGTTSTMPFQGRDEARRFCDSVEAAAHGGREIIEWKGKTIAVTGELRAASAELRTRIGSPHGGTAQSGLSTAKYLLIRRNDGSLEYQESKLPPADAAPAGLPASLVLGGLMDHQRQGLEWLQRAYLGGKRGCLLADDMGLGKTLQTLAFLAWLIESGRITPPGGDTSTPPWNPILVVAPLTLIEAETWQDDAKRFFRGSGGVFQPWLVLRGRQLMELRVQPGAETTVFGPVLDVDRLLNHRVIFTNYETVVRYQFTFSALRDRISVLVCDEAQEAKTPDTKTDHALKSLDPRFRVACTGTPVETRLLDLWNIMDLLQPGSLLGTLKQFSERYEKPVAEGPEAGRAVLAELKGRLGVGRPSGYVLRREKAQLRTLPPKNDVPISCDLSEEQRQLDRDLVSSVGRQGTAGHPFHVLNELMRLYQHPALLARGEPPAPADALAQCPKLRALLEQLAQIRRAGEKALIFTRILDMQQMLQSVIAERLGVRADIVNGAVPRSGDTRHSREGRKQILDRFRAEPGFAVIILSPDVAGLGLTLIEANHVFHYGRWWNPARERQATDRAYRLGQQRPVSVYYLIAEDPRHEFQTFDQKLDALIKRRLRLAADFLTPLPGEEELGRELFDETIGAASAPASEQATVTDLDSLDWRRFEALAAMLEAKRGAEVILTPAAGDDKADVIALQGRELRLIQCKHSASSAAMDADVVAEVLNALDFYHARYLGAFGARCSIRPTVVTNSRFTRTARRLASERGVELVDGEELKARLQAHPCSRGEIETQEAKRLASQRQLPEAVRALAARIP